MVGETFILYPDINIFKIISGNSVFYVSMCACVLLHEKHNYVCKNVNKYRVWSAQVLPVKQKFSQMAKSINLDNYRIGRGMCSAFNICSAINAMYN